jgi:hypothetical protein
MREAVHPESASRLLDQLWQGTLFGTPESHMQPPLLEGALRRMHSAALCVLGHGHTPCIDEVYYCSRRIGKRENEHTALRRSYSGVSMVSW